MENEIKERLKNIKQTLHFIQNEKVIDMKTCYMCHGKLKKSLVDVNIEGVVVKDVLADVCSQCGEQYFDTKTSTFIQNVTKYVTEQRQEVVLGIEKATKTPV